MASAISDPKGYYRVLGLPPGAGFQAVKRAYRDKAMQLHPDRNPSPNAVAEFQLLSDAYRVLSDPMARQAYHRGGGTTQATRASTGPSLRACTACGRVTAQPRYVIFEKVTARRWRPHHESISGVYCRRCADRTALLASLHCWMRGWWAFPSGPFHTVIALGINLRGGMRPRRENTALLLGQAQAFLSHGQRDLAYDLAVTARDMAGSSRERAVADRLINAVGGDMPARRLKDVWRRPGAGFWLQIILPASMVLMAFLIALPWLRDIGAGEPAGRKAVERVAPPTPGVLLADPSVAAQGGRVYAVSAPTTAVRAAPGMEFDALAILQRNTFVLVLESGATGEWVRVITAQGVVGYVPQDDVRPLRALGDPGPVR
ncbi:DnaJ domain-containing protein [Pararhodospirillum oryzae]|uniref:Molecular chaperone DnaJ n=1 Tax=Pararhodospirillum oryzae TaxID=478448 RepID=A0A512HA05_9PROT|nr:DnaJ domain-containing protein [Pararhodospirillum oryzae]GEO82262.1 molecular chaperone DnaJ [Pararhodospirillum oryzae]